MQAYKQKGAVLVVSIVILLILTFIAVSTLQTTPLAQKIAYNWRDATISLQTADTALREAESYVDGLANTNGFTNANGLYTAGNAPDPLASGTWTGSASISSSQSLTNVITPRYYIEVLGTYGNGGVSLNIYNYGQDPNGGDVTIFRIVARATGTSGNAETIVQSFYGRRF
jgi:type IV pilus assembly protein PilX